MNKNIVSFTLATVLAIGSVLLLSDKIKAQASSVVDARPAKDCMIVYDVAASIMMQRQNAADLRGMLEAVRGDDGRTMMVKEAFKFPQMNLDINKEKAVKQFAEEMWKICEDN